MIIIEFTYSSQCPLRAVARRHLLVCETIEMFDDTINCLMSVCTRNEFIHEKQNGFSVIITSWPGEKPTCLDVATICLIIVIVLLLYRYYRSPKAATKRSAYKLDSKPY